MAEDDLTFTTGDVSGTAVQAHTIHGDVYVYARPELCSSCPPPSCWAEAEEPPAEIQALLWAQRQAAHQLPYRLPGARKPSLDTMYVRQNLGTGVEEPEQPAQARQTSLIDDHRHLLDTPPPPLVRIRARPPSRTMREAMDGDAHLLVTGGPGQGKSTLSLRLAADIAGHWANGEGEPPLSEPVVPLRLTARSLAARLDMPFGQALADSVSADYGPLLRLPVSAAILAERVVGCRWLLIVDGLDEVADGEHRIRLVSALAAWASASTYRVLLTTRPIEGGALAPLHRIGAVRYELQPFDEAALKRFATNWFEPDEVHRFLRQIREAHLDELVQVPLLATIAAIIFEHSSQPLPGNQYSLYETYFAHIRSGTSSPFEEHRIPLLEHLARTRLESEASLLEAARTWVADRVTLDSPTWQDDLTTFLVSVGPFAVRGDDLAFLHHSFAEHLAATSLARELPAEFDENAFATALHAARPRESGRFARQVLLHHTRLHPGEADRLLRWLHAGDVNQHLLAARLLAHHLPASVDLMESFLATVWDWAMTTQYTAGEILAKATRATHHPGLVSWLLRLMRNANAPWRSRAEAATALAVRVRGPATCEALEFLHVVVDEPGAAVQDRLIAAEGLAQCGAAQREIAARVLRAVLADANATGATCRAAAVVLSTLDGDARVHAVDALMQRLSDVDIRPQDLVEVATGLLEISIDFHEVCAEAFLKVLRSPVHTTEGRRDAALGLASLGSESLSAAVAALTEMITDRAWPERFRADAAAALGDLGPVHRQKAGELIAAELAASVSLTQVRIVLATQLSYLGPAFRDTAVTHLRALLNDCGLREHDLGLVVGAMANLGSELRVEAAAQFVDRGLRKSHSRATVLECLEKLGEPYRSPALEEMRSVVADESVWFEVRGRLARHLIQSAPELHEHAISCLLSIAARNLDLEAVWTAWAELNGTWLQERVFAEMLAMCGKGQHPGSMFRLGTVASSRDVECIRTAGEALSAIMDDPERPMSERMTSALGLIYVGRAWDLTAARWLAAIIRSAEVTIWDFSYLAGLVASQGSRSADLCAHALFDVLRDARTTTERAWNLVQGMEILGLGKTPEVIAALRSIVGDECFDDEKRAAAAVLAMRHDPSMCSMAVSLVIRACGVMYREELHTALRDLGADLARQFQLLLSDADVEWVRRTGAAIALHNAAELRRHSVDGHLHADGSLVVLQSLAGVDPAEVPRAKDTYVKVLDDHDLPIAVRTRAARELMVLDRRSAAAVVAELRRVVENSHLHPDDRAFAASWLRPMISQPAWFFSAVTAIARHPALGHDACRKLVSGLPRTLMTEIEEVLLRDRTAEINLRVPKADMWDDLPLCSEAVAAMREVITAPESRTCERVRAATALARLNWSLVPEAIAALERFDTTEARVNLAGLGRRQQVYDEAMRVTTDENAPFRRRFAAALLIDEISDSPGPQVLEVLLLARSWRERVKAWAVAKDLAALRAVRDDPDALPAARRKASLALIDRRAEDRAAAARVLEEIAADDRIHPRMRWRAAADLGELGVLGRERALVVLRNFACDEELPAAMRALAAGTWYELKPTAKREVLAVLNGLGPESPLQRMEVLKVLAKVDFARPVTELQEMGANEPSPVVRMWCARAMVELRRDQQEKAAAIARAVAWDETVPNHIRRRAAGDLARWSELMREDARALLSRLRDCATR
ncbi:NACHT domain-containing protein [Lentzea flava]|uniref:NACHT domain-containing protein n=1 Tax=Lentzea flava TaxID=103732 RepID=A0ABQ2UIB9_9PSEU|nr:NACHT domain-containing protein [Lentzea flava]MCP2199778.1 NACHT domain-containing protein [Lentzea flava]GGU38385.1 hypothetical protein GCM10010178_33310 [Lentzea flava]